MKKLSFHSLSKWFATCGALGILALGAFIPTTVSAATTQAPRCGADDLKCIISAGDLLINNRLNSLNSLKTKITDDQTARKLTDAQANELLSDVSTNVSGLQSLKTKLDAENVAKEARKDVANMYTQFRIYAVVLPRDHRHVLLDIEVNAHDKMVSAEPTIQNAITRAPADQQDKLNALFNDYKQNVAGAEVQFNTANQALPQMTPEDFNQHRVAYEATRKSLDNATKTARQDLSKAADDLKQIVKILGHDI
ncbi:MAG TPA: hypothetical protein VFN35_18430 [Ktedonobacteraceae bacterium]|nr:hypothetical protein [Ktedonobacteraceae bacterium]